MSTRCVLGIDPGITGALAFYSMDGELWLYDVPYFEVIRGRKMRKELDHVGLATLFSEFNHAEIVAGYVEEVSSMPQQGVASMFTFGQAYGALKQAVADVNVPFHKVPPRTWQKELHVRKGKDASRMRASELMPKYSKLWHRVKDHNRAEAALIAYYGACHAFKIERTRTRLPG